MYAGDISRKFKTCLWEENKAKSIDYSRDFIWIEDEKKVLGEKDCLHKWIYINPYDEMNLLYDLMENLKLKYHIEGSE